MQIEGNGNSRTADVSKEFRLTTESKSRPSEEVEAQQGHAFILHAECHTAAAVAGGLMAFQNTSTVNDVVITRIYIDPQTITPTDLIITQVKEPVIASGTDISATGIIQKNFGVGTLTPGVLTISDGAADMTYTGGTQYHAFPANTMASTKRNMNGTNVVSPGTTILWGFKSAGAATDAEIVSLSVNFFIRSINGG